MLQIPDLNGLFIVVLAISVIPFFAMVVTSYTKIVVVLGLVRNALGVQQVPPNMVLNGIAIIISAYVMAPIGIAAMGNFKPAQGASSAQNVVSGFDAAREPFRQFLKKHTGTGEIQFFLRSAGSIWPKEQAQELKPDDLIVLAPSFTLTELTDAFKIGFMLYIAFVAVDLIVANVLMAMGLNQVSPTNVSIPFKLMLFVVMDGWSHLIHGLVLTYK
ncbi:type III secretion system export apparatus subunit SctR [Paraburkholderia youngii]|uniref:type III secretion system export apparatus subunit SctR n=1 Tax=Paraburkholderia youngii TaxID=2782701 RepID=UPI003D1F69DF